MPLNKEPEPRRTDIKLKRSEKEEYNFGIQEKKKNNSIKKFLKNYEKKTDEEKGRMKKWMSL